MMFFIENNGAGIILKPTGDFDYTSAIFFALNQQRGWELKLYLSGYGVTLSKGRYFIQTFSFNRNLIINCFRCGQ
jgi:hypothetical protein